MDVQTIRDRTSVLDQLLSWPGETITLNNVTLFDEGGTTIYDTDTSVLYIMNETVDAFPPDGPPIPVKRLLVRYICSTLGERGLGWYYPGENEGEYGSSIQMHDTGELAASLTAEQFAHIVAGMHLQNA